MKACIKAQVRRKKRVTDVSRQARFFFFHLYRRSFFKSIAASGSEYRKGFSWRVCTAETGGAFESFTATEIRALYAELWGSAGSQAKAVKKGLLCELMGIVPAGYSTSHRAAVSLSMCERSFILSSRSLST